jgi:hypothetical protein
VRSTLSPQEESVRLANIKHQPRKGISEIEGKGAMGSAERERVTSEFQTSHINSTKERGSNGALRS